MTKRGSVGRTAALTGLLFVTLGAGPCDRQVPLANNPNGTPNDPRCPSNPVIGQACAAPGLVCSYATDCNLYLQCSAGQWVNLPHPCGTAPDGGTPAIDTCTPHAGVCAPAVKCPADLQLKQYTCGGDTVCCSPGTASPDLGTASAPDACTAQCSAMFPHSGFELLFNGCCNQCTGSCGNTNLCQPGLPGLVGACLACLDPLLDGTTCSVDGWATCQGNPTCKSFVNCIKSCPTGVGKACTAQCDGSSDCDPGQYCPDSCFTCPCSGTCQPQTFVCTLGQDWTCNDGPVNGVHGQCVASNGPVGSRCVCLAGFQQNATTGKCL
jgi:hypothetical protein